MNQIEEKENPPIPGRVSTLWRLGGFIWPAKPMVKGLCIVKSDYKSDYFQSLTAHSAINGMLSW